jgi:hypothetical protein
MERDGAGMSLHMRLMAALARGARAQEDSRELLELMGALRARLDDTRAQSQMRRAERDVARRRP